MDVADYFIHREREMRSHTSGPLENVRVDVATDGQRGRMQAIVGLTEYAYLKVYERVVVEAGAFQITKYAYTLVMDDETVWAEEKDPTHSPAVHGHVGSSRRRVASDEVSLEEALELAWEQVDRDAEFRYEEEGQEGAS